MRIIFINRTRQVHTLIILFIASFYALVPILKHCMIRMRLTCGYWEVDDEVEPIALFIIKPWELLLRYAIIAMLCS